RPGHPAAALRGGGAPGAPGAGHHRLPGRLGRQPPAGGRRGGGGRARVRRAGGRPGPRAALRPRGRPAAPGAGGGQCPGARAVGGAGAARLPAVGVLAALGAALFGLLPRLVVGATWAILGVVLAVTMFGEPLQLSQWLLDLSPFVHLPRLPAATFTATPLLWLV